MRHGIYPEGDKILREEYVIHEDAFSHAGPWAVENWFSNGHNSQAQPLLPLPPRNDFVLMQVQVKSRQRRELYCKKAVVWVGSTCKHLHKPIEMKTLSSPGYCRTYS